MTKLYQPNLLHRHALLARQGGGIIGDPNAAVPPASPPGSATPARGVGNRKDSSSVTLSPSPTTADSSTSFSNSVPSASSPSLSSDPTSSSASSVQPTSSSPSIVKSSTTPSSTFSSTSATSSSASSTSSSSSTTSSSQPTPSVLQQTPTTFTSPPVDTNQLTPTPLVTPGTPTNLNAPATTVSQSSVTTPSSNLSAGNIVGIVAGTLIGLALSIILVAFVLRRCRRRRRRAMRGDSEFGTFRRSMFMTTRTSASPSVPSTGMTETDNNVAPSLKDPYSAATVKPTSVDPLAATAATSAAGGNLHERPKYVYGQDPTPANQQQREQEQYDDAGSDAHGGAFSSQPQAQSAYSAEAYGGYARYEDVGDGVVGGVPAGTAVYQDAQRGYQGQQGYDQHLAQYDQSQYRGYGQQQQAHGHSVQHPQTPRAYVTGSNGAGAGAYVAY